MARHAVFINKSLRTDLPEKLTAAHDTIQVPISLATHHVLGMDPGLSYLDTVWLNGTAGYAKDLGRYVVETASGIRAGLSESPSDIPPLALVKLMCPALINGNLLALGRASINAAPMFRVLRAG